MLLRGQMSRLRVLARYVGLATAQESCCLWRPHPQLVESGGLLHRFRIGQHFSYACDAASDADADDDEVDDGTGDGVASGVGAWLHKLPPVPPREIGADGEAVKLTASKWVTKCLPDVPHSIVQKIFRKRSVKVESIVEDPTTGLAKSKLQRVSSKVAVKEGVVLCVPASLAELGTSKPPKNKHSDEPTGEEVKWLRNTVLHKDEDLIVINKPPGLPVQGGSNVEKSLDSLMGAALSYDSSEGPRLVHRLDKDVSGAMILARTYRSTLLLQNIICSKETSMPDGSCGKGMDRRYTALVIGVPGAKKGIITAPLLRMVMDGGKSDRIMIADDPNSENALEAITEYKVLRRSVLGCTWIQLRPITGRKHQLRVHCAQGLGMPIVGDEKYGWKTHKNWLEERDMEEIDPQDLKARKKMAGSVVSKKPILHLHSRELLIPRLREKEGELEEGEDPEKMRFLAPLPPHMAASWGVKQYEKPKPKPKT